MKRMNTAPYIPLYKAVCLRQSKLECLLLANIFSHAVKAGIYLSAAPCNDPLIRLGLNFAMDKHSSFFCKIHQWQEQKVT